MNPQVYKAFTIKTIINIFLLLQCPVVPLVGVSCGLNVSTSVPTQTHGRYTPHLFTFSHLTSSPLHILSSSLLHLFTSSHIHIFTSSLLHSFYCFFLYNLKSCWISLALSFALFKKKVIFFSSNFETQVITDRVNVLLILPGRQGARDVCQDFGGDSDLARWLAVLSATC